MSVQVGDTRNINAMGFSVQIDQSTSGDSFAGASPSVPRAKTGTLSTRTDDDTGVVTAETGHGIITSDKVDVYWEDGKRVLMDATVSGDDITLDGGSGDNLPDEDTEVTVMVPQSEVVGIVGNNMVALLGRADTRATIHLKNGATVHKTIDIESATDGYGWNSADGTTNPIAGDTVLTAHLSHDDGVNARGVGVLAIVN